MGRIEGLYTAISSIIKEKESENKLVISTDDVVEILKDEDYLATASRADLEEYLLRFAVAIGLNDNGYRSVVKGEGLYINLENCTKREYLDRLHNNAVEAEHQREQIVKIITKQRELAEIAGQTEWDEETGTIIEQVSIEKLLEMLRKEAENEDL